jgi:hypothetical protein
MVAQQFTASVLPAVLRQRGLLVLHATQRSSVTAPC